jgi:hypothetical protein
MFAAWLFHGFPGSPGLVRVPLSEAVAGPCSAYGDACFIGFVVSGARCAEHDPAISVDGRPMLGAVLAQDDLGPFGQDARQVRSVVALSAVRPWLVRGSWLKGAQSGMRLRIRRPPPFRVLAGQVGSSLFDQGAPGRIRTCDARFRNRALLPAANRLLTCWDASLSSPRAVSYPAYIPCARDHS